jgi:hypothetical protein
MKKSRIRKMYPRSSIRPREPQGRPANSISMMKKVQMNLLTQEHTKKMENRKEFQSAKKSQQTLKI